MFDVNQIVKIKWNNTNRDWYESKGYVYTKRYCEFEVKVGDLSPKSSCRINAVCDYCGNKYSTQYAVIMNGRNSIPKDACPHCAPLKANEINLKKRIDKNFELLNAICKKNGYRLITKPLDYIDTKMQVLFECPKHGIQSMILDNLKHGHKCFACSYENRFDNLKNSKDYVNQIISSKNDNVWLNQDEYTNSIDRNLKIRCKCGNTYITSFSNFVRAGINRCRTCSQKESSGELRIRKYLETNKIDFEQEKRFIDCKDNKPLPFDFYLPGYNICIEFDGQQHYKDIYGYDSLDSTQCHDRIKNKYCADKGIKLLRIPYWQGSQIENILQQTLKL